MYSIIFPCQLSLDDEVGKEIVALGGRILPSRGDDTFLLLPESIQTGEVLKDGGAILLAMKFPDGEIIAYYQDADELLSSAFNNDPMWLWDSFVQILPFKEL